MRKPRLLVVLAIVVLGALLLVGCGGSSGTTTTSGGGSTTTAAPGGSQVTIQNFAFSPAELTVPVGTTVTWTNSDSTNHTVTSDTAVFESATLARGDTFEFTFTQAGEFPYHCSLHPSMTATIIVTG